MEEIKVSIICLAYNHEKYIRECLESLVTQKTSFKYEILVHDDASKDKTADIIREYEAKYPDIIKPIYQTENQYKLGKKITLDILIPKSTGKYIAFCEGDDFWCNNEKLQIQYDVLEKNSDCTICTHKVQKVENNGTPMGEIVQPKTMTAGKINSNIFFKSYFKDSYPFQTTSYFIRKEIFNEKPNFLYHFGVGDVAYLFLAASKGKIYYLNVVYSCWRQNVPGSFNSRLRSKEFHLRILKKRYEGIEYFNKDTENLYYNDLKIFLNYYKLQYHYASQKKDFTVQEIKDIKKALSLKLRIKAKLKYSKLFSKRFFDE